MRIDTHISGDDWQLAPVEGIGRSEWMATVNPYGHISQSIANGGPGGWRPIWRMRIWLGTDAFDGMAGTHSYVIDGWLYLTKKYRWNGSNVVPDKSESLLASAIHDALCEICRTAKDLSFWAYWRLRRLADKIYRMVCRAQGLFTTLARLRYIGLRLAAPWHALQYKV